MIASYSSNQEELLSLSGFLTLDVFPSSILASNDPNQERGAPDTIEATTSTEPQLWKSAMWK
jgi:hypothetical protein